MMTHLNSLVNRINSLKFYLLMANFILVSSLIVLSNLSLLPLGNLGDFAFIAFIAFIFALYRPGWGFLFFIGTIALENINLAPEILGIMIRPYQLIGFLTFLAVGVRYLTKRLNFPLPKFIWADYVLALFSLGGFLSALNANDSGVAFKQSIIIVSFFVLYILTRIFIQSLDDIKKIIPFFLSSNFVLLLYGIWQNWRFMQGKNGFEVMPGRVNATFTEPDWWGIFLVFLLATLLVIVYKINEKIKVFGIKNNKTNFVYFIFVWILIILAWMNLIITASRSAWLGALVLIIALIFYLSLKSKVKLILLVIGSIFISLMGVYFLKLTNFELRNRLESTTSGEQEITIACDSEVEIASPIGTVNELASYGCRHINLEDIQREMKLGKVVKKIYRQDPNVSIRKEIYLKSLSQIKEHWFFGIGWGNINQILGKDERGAGLNSSNLFLEVWLGSGLLGLISFLVLVIYIAGRGKMFFWKKFRAGKLKREDSGMDFFYLFLILSATAISVPNLFNAGIMLGFLWLWLGISFVKD